MNSKGFRTVMMVCLWIVLAFMYIPIIAIIGMSFNATKYGMFPYEFTTKWYTTLFTTSNLLPAALFSLQKKNLLMQYMQQKKDTQTLK